MGPRRASQGRTKARAKARAKTSTAPKASAAARAAAALGVTLAVGVGVDLRLGVDVGLDVDFAALAFAQAPISVAMAPRRNTTAALPPPSGGDLERAQSAGEAQMPPALPLSVPPKLAARFRALETSGLAWAAALDRYLVVIDETDEQGGRERAPVVLTLSRDGRFDNEPLPIEGVAEIDDAEAIAAAGDNRFLLLTSHSATRSGNVRPSRRQLIELVADNGPAGRRLRAARRLDLLDGPGGLWGFLRSLDVDLSRGLDAEGIAYHAGAIFIGLKEPLGRSGEALIVRIADPERALARGQVPKRALSLWARLTLNAPPGAPDAPPQGVADLLFAGSPPSLFVASNAPKVARTSTGGALWSWAAQAVVPAAAVIAPSLLAHFRGLHPEGLAVAPDGKTVVVLFDPGTGRPHWTSFPLPSPASP